MVKLKTVKELKRGLLELKSLEEKELSKAQKKFISDMDTDKRYASIEELRQEAIKWIKKLNQFYKDHPCEEWSCQASESKTMQELSKKLHVNIEHIIGCGEYKCTHQGVNLLKLWIKYFFNITEEDLK